RINGFAPTHKMEEVVYQFAGTRSACVVKGIILKTRWIEVVIDEQGFGSTAADHRSHFVNAFEVVKIEANDEFGRADKSGCFFSFTFKFNHLIVASHPLQIFAIIVGGNDL